MSFGSQRQVPRTQATRAVWHFTTVEVWTKGGLASFYLLFVMELKTRRVQFAGCTTNPNGAWMKRVARELTNHEDGFLNDKKYLIMDRDSTFCSRSEATEKFYITLGQIAGTRIGTNRTHVVTLKDDDPTVSISTPLSSVSESTTDPVRFEVKLSAPTNKEVTVPFRVKGDAKRGSDYTIYDEKFPIRRTNYTIYENYVTIAANQTTAVLEARIKNDSEPEATETLGIELVDQNGVRIANATVGTNSEDSVKIGPNIGLPSPEITQIRGLEGDSGYTLMTDTVAEGGYFRILISMPQASDETIYIPVKFPSGSGRATSPSDFTVSNRIPSRPNHL